ncbi:MAG: DUF4411 family protein [Bdellovibrionales bacterium]|nr:DUF4411 family protein [Bdellovibrionales bacterium]
MGDIGKFCKKNIVFSPIEVKRELEKVDDDLLEWVKNKSFFKDVNEDVQKYLRTIMKKYPRLTDSSKGRSMADPWVIAHAQTEEATVVTLEQEAAKPEKKVNIPDACKQEGIACIDIYHLIGELKIEFTAKIKK